MRTRKFVAFAFCMGVVANGLAQTHQDVLNFIAKGKLKEAQTSLEKTVASKAVTGADYQLQGLIFASNGEMLKALQAFVSGYKLSPQVPGPSGLENLPYDSALLRKLSCYRGEWAVSNGQAAFLNNIGLCQVMLGRTKIGMTNLDGAIKLANKFTAPWVNLAVGDLLKGQPSAAVTAAKKALNLGDNTVMAKAIMADADISTNEMKDALNKLNPALQDEPDHPIALAVRARLANATGDSRGAERYRSQALAYGAPIIVDGPFRPTTSKGGGGGGSADELHYNGDQKIYSPGAYGADVNLASDKGRVQDRSDAYQSLTQGLGELGSALSALHFDYKDLGAGRPGPETFEPGVISNPNANLNFHQANMYGDQHVGPVLFHGRLRASEANVDDSGSSTLGHGNDTQEAGEMRYDFSKIGGKNNVGFAYDHLNRNQINGYAIDPTEELLPNGQSDMWTAYFLHKRDLNKFMSLSLGGTVGHNGRAMMADPYFDFAVHLGTKNLLHVGYSSLFNSDVSDLMPNEMRPASPVDDPIDRDQNTTTPYNRNPLLLTEEGRQQTFLVSLRTTVNPSLGLNTTAFHHNLQDFTIQGTDPQTATFLNQNVFSSGQATGVSEEVNWDVASRLGVNLKTYVQTTHMSPAAGLYNGTQPGAPVPLDLPYFPNVGLDLGLAYHGFNWTGSLVATTVGHRTVATGVPLGNGQFCCSYIQIENPVTSWNLFAHANLPFGEAYVAVYNITKVSFYPGDPGHVTLVLGVQL